VKYNATVSPTYTDVVIPRVTIQEIALTADEVSRIAYFDVDLFYANRRADFRERMKRIRDMFVLGCSLGQRHSDLVRTEPSCFDRNIYRITQQKTGNLAVVNIDQCIGSDTLHVVSEIGHRLPLHATSQGKLLLSRFSDTEALRRVGSMTAFTPHTISDHDALLAALHRIEANGYAVEDGEYRIGLRSVSAPVYDRSRNMAYAIGVVGFFRRVASEEFAAVIEATQAAGRALSQALGYQEL
jgi:hypothetical protein